MHKGQFSLEIPVTVIVRVDDVNFNMMDSETEHLTFIKTVLHTCVQTMELSGSSLMVVDLVWKLTSGCCSIQRER